MSDSARDPVGAAAARLEAAVERLTEAFARGHLPAAEGDMVPRAEVAAMAERLEATIARLRGALAEELRPEASAEPPPAETY
ncbi:hypothetical protein JMJ56_05335 [Belnapia sp. T18]|uniref:Uncharacterized protein n=1 Tax=Belnapia arida TaxID=2804533 RepID=A0ABS1U141_9PROT|nr:hypothetical protein [Belnapia arida]MBL6077422.1 hypothetical protein [Belnapia arida]